MTYIVPEITLFAYREDQPLTFHPCLMTAHCLPKQQHMVTEKMLFTIHLAAVSAATIPLQLLQQEIFLKRSSSKCAKKLKMHAVLLYHVWCTSL